MAIFRFFFLYFFFYMLVQSDPAMSTSRTEITVNGLELSVYGLKEYKNLDNNMPVAVLFAMHGRLRKSLQKKKKWTHSLILFTYIETKSSMEAIAQVLCSHNGKKGGKLLDRHLLVVAFDHLNHGTRLQDKKRNYGWTKDKNNNPTQGMDQWGMVSSAQSTVTSLIDVLEYYLFGPDSSPVQVWGCLGFSMGAHASFITAAFGKWGE
jgi:hypothetical protein